jgi:hypothetical protein
MALNFPDNPTLNQVYSAGGKTWSYNGSRWVLVIATAIIDVADGSITAAKIADGTVVAAEIANNAITTDKIASGAVTAAKLGDDISLTPADGSITQAKLAASLSGITVTTTANRGTDVASPFTGQTIFLSDVTRLQVWDGSAWIFVTNGAPGAPTSLSATALSTTSVSVSFTPGASAGASPINYKYSLSTDGGSTYGEPTALDPADITSPITISGLTGGQTYHIKLRAVSDFGDSPDSTATSLAVPTVPSAPTSLSATPSTTSVSIAFTAGADGGSAITNYQYATSTDSGSTYSSFTALSPEDATTPITITGLSEGTAYYIKLKTVSAFGPGAESSAVSFTTLTSVSTEYLVIAGGGGGGGAYYAAGGGAGGYRSSVTGEVSGGGAAVESVWTAITGISYTVQVGAGGGGGSGGQNGGQGSNTSISGTGLTTITSLGGGYGGKSNTNGNSGGSGGGGGSGAGIGGAGTSGQGFAGGNAAGGGLSGGGGGAGAVGTTVGGTGVASSITGSSVFRGGGGGGAGYSGSGSSGGNGGGGRGGDYNVDNDAPGTANTGGGGGGGNGYYTSASTAGSAGGSGVVILRYSNARTITIGAGLTGSTSPVGAYRVTTITAGSGNVSWA